MPVIKKEDGTIVCTGRTWKQLTTEERTQAIEACFAHGIYSNVSIADILRAYGTSGALSSSAIGGHIWRYLRTQGKVSTKAHLKKRRAEKPPRPQRGAATDKNRAAAKKAEERGKALVAKVEIEQSQERERMGIAITEIKQVGFCVAPVTIEGATEYCGKYTGDKSKHLCPVHAVRIHERIFSWWDS